jgi:hypothetical protein
MLPTFSEIQTIYNHTKNFVGLRVFYLDAYGDEEENSYNEDDFKQNKIKLNYTVSYHIGVDVIFHIKKHPQVSITYKYYMINNRNRTIGRVIENKNVKALCCVDWANRFDYDEIEIEEIRDNDWSSSSFWRRMENAYIQLLRENNSDNSDDSGVEIVEESDDDEKVDNVVDDYKQIIAKKNLTKDQKDYLNEVLANPIAIETFENYKLHQLSISLDLDIDFSNICKPQLKELLYIAINKFKRDHNIASVYINSVKPYNPDIDCPVCFDPITSNNITKMKCCNKELCIECFSKVDKCPLCRAGL